jgi:plastocyanin
MSRLTQVSRWLFALFVALAGTIAPFTQTPAHAATIWKVNVGGSSSDQAIQTNYFFPREITIAAGDSIQFTPESGETHTATFLNNMPPPQGYSPFNGPLGSGAYDGTKQVGSGLLVMGVPAFNLAFAANTKPGDYQFNCLIHSNMHGVVHVLAPGTPVPHDQAWYDQQAKQQFNEALQQGRELLQEGQKDRENNQVTMGLGELTTYGGIAILRFLPSNFNVKVGQVVTFRNRDPETPHTYTQNLEPPATPGFDPTLVIPSDLLKRGVANVSSPGEDVNSGFIANVQIPGFAVQGNTFKVRFAKEGVYTFRCDLHDTLGMVGKITVTK